MKCPVCLAAWVGLAGAVLTSGCRCEDSTQASAAASSSAPSSSASSAAVSAAPSGTPPPEARPLAEGGHWLLLKTVPKRGPSPGQAMVVKATFWTHDGTPVYSTRDGTATFPVSSLPAELQSVFGQLGPGARARFWLSPELTETWRPPSFPSAPLVADIEMVGVAELKPPPPASSASARPAGSHAGLPPPDLTGPPEGARTAGSLRYEHHAQGGTRSPTPTTELQLRVSIFELAGLLVRQVQRGVPVTLTPNGAPGGLGAVLLKMKQGDAARVWVPKDRAAKILPGLGQYPVVLDVTIESIGK